MASSTYEILLPHQLKAAGKMHNGCILKGATGTGKTITALAYYKDNENPERLIVITTGKKRDSGDWEAEARLLAIFPEVDSWNNISKYENVTGAFFIFDEQRVVGSGAWVKSFLKITRKNSWVLLSATPGDSWMDYIPVFVANGFYRNRTEFLREHVVFSQWTKYPRVERYLNIVRLVNNLSAVMIEMPYEKHTVRHEVEVYCEYDRERFDTIWKRRWHPEKERPVRHVSELLSLIRRVVNSDASRLERVRDLLVIHPKLIIFYNFDYELDILKGGLEGCRDLKTKSLLSANGKTGDSSGSNIAYAGGPCTTSEEETPESFAVAEWNGHKHEKIPQSDSWVYLVQYAAGSEGWNCTETDAMVFYSLTYSYRMFHQAKGRIDRLGTPYTDLYYYIFRSPSIIDNAIATNLSQKRNFNEARFMREAR